MVELGGADAEVEQASGDLIRADASYGIGDAVEPGMAQGHSLTMWCEASAGSDEGNVVSVEAEDRRLIMGAEKSFGVTAAAERGVDDHTGGNVRENRDDFVEHD